MCIRRRVNFLAYFVPLTVATALYLPGMFFKYWLSDAALYAAITLRITRTGEWWELGEANATFFNKPPLAFWVHALFVKVLGEADWVLRLPSVLAALACVALTVSIVKRLQGPRVGLLAGVLLALCDEYVLRIAHYRIDFLLTVLMLAGVRMCVEGYVRAGLLPTRSAGSRSGSRGVWWMVGSGLPIGLGLMVKPFYALLALVLVAVWMFVCGGVGRRRAVWVGLGAMLAVMVAAPWHVSMVMRHGESFVNCYFIQQSVARATGEAMRPEPWYWYLRYLVQSDWAKDAPFALGPVHHLLWLVPVVGVMVRGVRGRSLSARVRPIGARLAVVWTIGLLVVLSVLADKRGNYLVPMYPGLAWLGAMWIRSVWRRGVVRVLMRVAVPLSVVTLIVMAIVRPDCTPRTWRPNDISKFHRFIRENPDEEYWDGSLYKFESSELYIRSGVWPKMIEDRNTGERWEPSVGAYVLYDLRHTPRPAVHDEVVVSGERFWLVRRGTGLIPREGGRPVKGRRRR